MKALVDSLTERTEEDMKRKGLVKRDGAERERVQREGAERG